jgi:L-threonylcarbamoyladenylate synthase
VPSAWQKRRFVESLYGGKVVAYPTESVFGLGCDPLNPMAVLDLLKLKKRGQHKGLILIASRFSQLSPFLKSLPESIKSRIHNGRQEPTTWLLPAKESVPTWLTGEHETLAVRLTQHPLAKELCELARTALVSTSANVAGCEPLKTAHQARLKFQALGVHVIGGRVGLAKKPSRIIDPFSNKQLR